MIPKVSRCTVDMLNQKMKTKTEDVGKTYGLRKTLIFIIT